MFAGLIRRMLGNKTTTAIGVVMALLMTLRGTGVIPAEYSLYVDTVLALLTSLGFVAAKDAATGSAPGAKFQ